MFFPTCYEIHEGLEISLIRSYFLLPPLSFFPPNSELQISVGTAGPQLRTPDLSGHCWTSAANSRSQWALLDLSCELQISVGTAGPQLRTPDLSGHCWTSAANSRSQWALLDLSCELQISVGTAGPQLRAPDLNRELQIRSTEIWRSVRVRQCPCQRECQNRCQIACRNRCQKECQTECRIECQIQGGAP